MKKTTTGNNNLVARVLWSIALVMLAVFVGGGVASAERTAETSLVGDWHGSLDVSAFQPGVSALRVQFRIREDGDGFTALLDSPDQDIRGLPASYSPDASGQVRIP